jgi:hypothetical protein
MSRVKEQEADVDNFYKLKQAYDSKYANDVAKVMNSKLSDSEKRERVKLIVRKCINCKRPGGTVFEVSPRHLKAVCNAEPRCDLNLEIDKGTPVIQAPELLNVLKGSIETQKSRIMSIKMMHGLGIVTDEEAIGAFDGERAYLEQLTRDVVRVEEHIIGLTNNIEKQEEINQKNIILFDMINQFKDLLMRFRETGQEGYMRDAIRLATEDIYPKAEEVRMQKYVVNTVITDEASGVSRLIQEPYTLEQMEIAVPEFERQTDL